MTRCSRHPHRPVLAGAPALAAGITARLVAEPDPIFAAIAPAADWGHGAALNAQYETDDAYDRASYGGGRGRNGDQDRRGNRMTPADIIVVTEKYLGRKLTESEVGVALAQAARLGLIQRYDRLPKGDVMAPRQSVTPAPRDTGLVCVAETSVPRRFIVHTRYIATRP
jgi:hypothetical protein